MDVLLPLLILCTNTPAASTESLFFRIDCSNDDDRIYLRGGFYPPARTEQFGPWGQDDWMLIPPQFQGGLLEVPVVPVTDNTIRIRIMPEAPCSLRFYVTDSGQRREYLAYSPTGEEGIRIGEDECVKTVSFEKAEEKIIEIPLNVAMIAGRERLRLLIRPVNTENPTEIAPVTTRLWWLEVYVDGPIKQVQPLIDRYQKLEKEKIEYERFTLVADSIVRPGETFRLFVVARRPSGLPDTEYRGTLTLYANTPDIEGVPDTITFTEEDRGVKRIDGLRASRDGAWFFRVHETDAPHRSWRSNYVLCDAAAEYGLYWGDLHVHTWLSDGYWSPDEVYQFARDVSALDFIALNDHESFCHPLLWEKVKEMADHYMLPGKFITFIGAEYTNVVRGHRNVWFPGTDVPDFYDRDKTFFSQPLSQFLERVLEHNGIVSSHHLHPVADFTEWNVQQEPVIEIFSSWGSSEKIADPVQTSILHGLSMVEHESAWDAIKLLDQGIQVGFIGGSDGHYILPGANMSQALWAGVCPSRRPGIAAIYAKSLSREDIFDALRKRRCYATMNERITIDFRINDAFMGEELTINESTVRIRVRAYGTAPLATVSIIRNGEVYYTYQTWGECTYVDFIHEDSTVPEGDNYYFLKVQQLQNGEYVNAWSSPIWVKSG